MGSPADGSEPRGAVAPGDWAAPPASSLYSLLRRLRTALASPFDRRTIGQLRRQIEEQAALISRVEAALTGAEIFERASASARMGTWQCELRNEHLTWSSATYDLFGLGRNCGLVRRDILKSYSEESLANLQRVRGGAIASGEGFKLDAEIHGPDFGTRWIRISATVERRNGEAVRLFGIKQDITEEKKTLEHMRHLAEHDVMTGLANRTQFQQELARICERGKAGGAVMLIDLDGFKVVNDTLGHAIGDECLIEFTRRLVAACQSADVIARIGGDEFAVLFGPAANPQMLEGIAQRLVEAAKAPMLCSGRLFNVSASIGFAFCEGETPIGLFTRADLALYAAKAVGGDAFQSSGANRL